MSKGPVIPGTPFPIRQNATTVGGNYVSAITPSPRLASITEAIVLTREPGGLCARVFRASSTARGFYSCDVYDRRDGSWALRGEERAKYEPPKMKKHEPVKTVTYGGYGYYCYLYYTTLYYYY